jgi:endogenous inhibitor of DNA gyrase (YacG/DUF329 family)
VTMPIEEIMVECPNCGKTYNDWCRRSINFSLGETFSDEYLDEATSATCPHCGYKVQIETLYPQWGQGPNRDVVRRGPNHDLAHLTDRLINFEGIC